MFGEKLFSFLIYLSFLLIQVSICDINTDAGEELLHQLSKSGKDRVIFCACDVTDYPQFEGNIVFFIKFSNGF